MGEGHISQLVGPSTGSLRSIRLECWVLLISIARCVAWHGIVRLRITKAQCTNIITASPLVPHISYNKRRFLSAALVTFPSDAIFPSHVSYRDRIVYVDGHIDQSSLPGTLCYE